MLVADATDPGTDWTHATVKLTAGSWHIGTVDGEVATNRQLAGVLSDVSSLQIRAEHVSGGEDGGLDNVVLKSRGAAPGGAFGEDHHALTHGAYAAPDHPADAAPFALA